VLPDGSREQPRVRNDLSGEAGNVVQAATINGDLHFHGAAQPGRTATAQPVARWDPFDLDVHRAIAVADLPVLPAYLHRDHDDDLDAHLADVDRSTMVVLTGESSTGKTRALYEAVRRHEVLRDWPLVYPRTADDLVAACDRIRPGTVLWLNEAQHHLGSAHAVAALRGLLEGAGPVVVLGTLWPQFWSAFTASDEHARSLLLHRVVCVRVADRFDGHDVARLKADGKADPRLITALATSGDGRRVIQTVAGGPALVERYRHPDSVDDRYATAVLSAALDARRLGFQGLLTRVLLADATEGYLTGEDRVDTPGDWFERGVDRAAKGDAHGITALIPKRVSPGVGPAEGYELHDYLDQQGRAARRSTPAPDSLWTALVEHAEGYDDRFRLAVAAYERLLYRYADQLRDGIEALATLLADRGHWDEALAVVRDGDQGWTPRWLADRLAAGGNVAGLRRLAATNCLHAAAHLVADDLEHGRLANAMEGLTALRQARHPLNADLVTLLVGRGQAGGDRRGVPRRRTPAGPGSARERSGLARAGRPGTRSPSRRRHQTEPASGLPGRAVPLGGGA